MIFLLGGVIFLLVLYIIWEELRTPTVGEINVVESDEKVVYTLDLTEDPKALEHKDVVKFKVNRKVFEESP